MLDIGKCIETTSAVVNGVRYHEDDYGNLYTEGEGFKLIPAGRVSDAPQEIVDALRPKAPWET